MVRFICLQCNIEVAQQDLFGRLRKDNLVNAIDIWNDKLDKYRKALEHKCLRSGKIVALLLPQSTMDALKKL